MPDDAMDAMEPGTAGMGGEWGESGGTDLPGAPSRAEEPRDAPEDMGWSAEQMDAFAAQTRDMGLTGGQAQKLLELARQNRESAQEAHAEQVRRWGEEVRADRDMGGAHFEATVMKAKAGLRAFDADGAVLAMLEKTGYANHPAVIRFLSRVGAAHAEDGLVSGGRERAERPLEERLYPHWNV